MAHQIDKHVPAAREILDYERRVNAALTRFHNRTSWEPQETKTPLSELVGSEDGMLDEWGVRNETIIRLAHFCSQDGIEPWTVLRNLYAVFGHMGIAPFAQLTTREKGILFGDSHGAHHWLMKRRCVDPLRRNGALSHKAPGQKGNGASASAAEAQRGNSNRKKKKKRPACTSSSGKKSQIPMTNNQRKKKHEYKH